MVRWSVLIRAAAGVAVMCLGACGNEDDPSSAGGAGGAGGTAASGGSGGASGGAGVAGTGGGAGSDAGLPLSDNLFFVSSGIFGGNANTNLIALGFAAKPGERCRVEQLDGCYVTDCSESLGTLPTPISAGTIKLLKDGSLLHEIDSDVTYGYTFATTNGALWTAGDSLTFQASGADVPAFTETLTAPPSVTVLAPTVGAPLQLDADLMVSWTPIQGGVSITANQVDASGPPSTSRRFLCEVDGSTGAFTVTQKVLSVLTLGPNVYLSIGGNATRDISPGGYSVHLHVINNSLLLQLPPFESDAGSDAGTDAQGDASSD